MNADRRKRIAAAAAKIDSAKCDFEEAQAGVIEQLETAKSELEEIMSEEQDAYDNMPDGLQSGEKGQAAEEAIELLQNAMDEIDAQTEALNEIPDKLQEAIDSAETATGG